MKLTRKLVLAKAKASDLESVKKLNCWQVFKCLLFLVQIVMADVDWYDWSSIFRICANVMLNFIFVGDATLLT